MLLPDPVGATHRTSRPASMAATTSDCPGLKASSPKTSLSVRSAFSIIPPECDGISWRDQRPLTRPADRPRLFQLHDADAVLARVDEPCHASKANVCDSIDGLEARKVIFLNLDTSRAQASELLLEVSDAPSGLSLLISCSD